KTPHRIAVVRIDGVTVAVTERRTTFHRESDFTRLGLDPRSFRIIVVKIGYLEPELAGMARAAFLALSPGAVNQNIAALNHKHIRRPMFPMDPVPFYSASESDSRLRP
ncbi:MlrC C-terminal domain-containing protein, partial [bacterium]|nr:MlrC C-terminal domain-containing protein [candidate division CSSED10-310 bacterium]